MFTIIGGDGNEYGPVSELQLRQWISAGRANLDTRARRQGETDWHRLGDLPEFGVNSPSPPPAPSPAVATDLAHPGVRLGAFVIDSVLAGLAMMPGMLMSA